MRAKDKLVSVYARPRDRYEVDLIKPGLLRTEHVSAAVVAIHKLCNENYTRLVHVKLCRHAFNNNRISNDLYGGYHDRGGSAYLHSSRRMGLYVVRSRNAFRTTCISNTAREDSFDGRNGLPGVVIG